LHEQKTEQQSLSHSNSGTSPFSSAFDPADRTDSQAFFAYAERQLFPATCFPGKTGQPPQASSW